MNVSLNGQKQTMFQGAKVKHLLLQSNPSLYHEIVKGTMGVVDSHGNCVELNGALDEGYNYRTVALNK